jgi:hypothetical protein
MGHPIPDERGDVVGFAGASIDVTEHHRARANLERAFEEIKRLRDQLHGSHFLSARHPIGPNLLYLLLGGSYFFNG